MKPNLQEKLYKDFPPHFYFSAQVGEDFDGGLVEGLVDSIVSDVVSDAESASSRACEACGKPGTLSTNGWYKVLCEEYKSAKTRKEC